MKLVFCFILWVISTIINYGLISRVSVFLLILFILYIIYLIKENFFSVSVVKNIVIYYEILYIYICIHVLALIVDRSCYLNVYHIFDIIFVMHTLLERFWLVVDVTWNQRHKVICKLRLDSVKHLKQWTDLKVVTCFANCFDVWPNIFRSNSFWQIPNFNLNKMVTPCTLNMSDK